MPTADTLGRVLLSDFQDHSINVRGLVLLASLVQRRKQMLVFTPAASHADIICVSIAVC